MPQFPSLSFPGSLHSISVITLSDSNGNEPAKNNRAKDTIRPPRCKDAWRQDEETTHVDYIREMMTLMALRVVTSTRDLNVSNDSNSGKPSLSLVLV